MSRQTVVLARPLHVLETPMQYFFARFRMTCTNFANGTEREHEISQSKKSYLLILWCLNLSHSTFVDSHVRKPKAKLHLRLFNNFSMIIFFLILQTQPDTFLWTWKLTIVLVKVMAIQGIRGVFPHQQYYIYYCWWGNTSRIPCTKTSTPCTSSTCF